MGDGAQMPRRPGSTSPLQLNTTPLPAVHLARHYTRPYIAARLRAGDWERVRTGAYVDALPHEEMYARQLRHALARLVALTEQRSQPPVCAFASAALVWGLPTLTVSPQSHVLQQSRPTGRGAPDVVGHCRELRAEHWVEHRGLRVTSLAQTTVDCAMALPPRAGLVVADAALHIGVDLAHCIEILDAHQHRRGVIRAREVLSLADAGAESPGETVLRFSALRLGLPVPETQIQVPTTAGTFWADLGWREWRLLCEYDGWAKYEANGSAAGAVLKEKRRQDAIEEEGWRVLRFARDDLRPADLLQRLRRFIPADIPLRPRPILNSL